MSICSECKSDRYPYDSCPRCHFKHKDVEFTTKNPRKMYRKLKSKIEDLKYEISKDEKDDFIIIRKDEVGNTGWAEFKIKGEKKLKNLELKKKKSNLGMFIVLWLFGILMFGSMSVMMGYGDFIKIPMVQYLFPPKYIIFLFVIYTFLISIISLIITRYNYFNISGSAFIEVHAIGEIYAGKNEQFLKSIEKTTETLSYELTFKVESWATQPESQNENIPSIKYLSEECESYVKYARSIIESDFHEILEYSTII